MKQMTFKHKQAGISLLELMISLGIGIILLLALASVYLTASNTSRARSAEDQLDESARQVFERLQADLDLAGYVDIFDKKNILDNSGNVTGTELVANSVAKTSEAVVQNMYGRLMPSGAPTPKTPIELASNGKMKALTGTDTTLTVAYQVAPGDPSASPSLPAYDATADSGLVLDCLGAKLAKADDRWIQNTYSFDSTDHSFKCAGVSMSAQPIVDNIQEMNFRYLVTQATTNSKANMYDSQSGLYTTGIVSAADVNDTSKNPLGWVAVTGVEVCMIVAGEPLSGRLATVVDLQKKIPTCARKAAGGYADDTNRPNGDKRLYRRYTKVLTVPNTLYFR